MKVCSKCKKEKELSEFYKHKNDFKSCCKICYKETRKERYKSNKEKELEYYQKNKEKYKEYYKNNKEYYNEYQKEWRENNKERLKEKRKERYKNNIEKIKEYRKEYYENNKEYHKEYNKEWRENNKEKRNEYFKEYNKNNKEKKKKWKENNKEYYNEYNKNRMQIDPLFKLRCNIRSLIGMSIKRNGFTKRSQTYNILGCTYEEFKIHLENQFTKGMSWENQGEWHLDHIYPVSLAKDEEELYKLNHYTNFQPLWAKDNKRKGNNIIEQQLKLL